MKKTEWEQIEKEFYKLAESGQLWDNPDAMPSGYSDGTDYALDKILSFFKSKLSLLEEEVKEETAKEICETIEMLKQDALNEKEKTIHDALVDVIKFGYKLQSPKRRKRC